MTEMSGNMNPESVADGSANVPNEWDGVAEMADQFQPGEVVPASAAEPAVEPTPAEADTPVAEESKDGYSNIDGKAYFNAINALNDSIVRAGKEAEGTPYLENLKSQRMALIQANAFAQKLNMPFEAAAALIQSVNDEVIKSLANIGDQTDVRRAHQNYEGLRDVSAMMKDAKDQADPNSSYNENAKLFK